MSGNDFKVGSALQLQFFGSWKISLLSFWRILKDMGTQDSAYLACNLKSFLRYVYVWLGFILSIYILKLEADNGYLTRNFKSLKEEMTALFVRKLVWSS